MPQVFVTFAHPDLQAQWLHVAPEHEQALERVRREVDQEPIPARRLPTTRVLVTWANGHHGPLLASVIKTIST